MTGLWSSSTEGFRDLRAVLERILGSCVGLHQMCRRLVITAPPRYPHVETDRWTKLRQDPALKLPSPLGMILRRSRKLNDT